MFGTQNFCSFIMQQSMCQKWTMACMRAGQQVKYSFFSKMGTGKRTSLMFFIDVCNTETQPIIHSPQQ